MNNLEKCCQRDRRVLTYLDALGCLDTDQVKALCFSGFDGGLRKAQQRMKRLTDLGRVNRLRPSLDAPYAYFTGERPVQIEHVIARNWVYLWLVSRCSSWEKVEGWYPEEDHGILRCDALADVRNKVTGKHRFYFVEVDRYQSGNRWDKAKKYTELCRRGIQALWVEQAESFPVIFCVTDHPARLEAIRKAVRDENPLGLRFEIRLLEEVRREALGVGDRARAVSRSTGVETGIHPCGRQAVPDHP